jgi:hypothetical protein
MSGSKAPDFDTYELLRATHYHNSTQYSHIVELSSNFYALMSFIIRRILVLFQ